MRTAELMLRVLCVTVFLVLVQSRSSNVRHPSASRVLSIGPKQMDVFQTVEFFLYSLDRIEVTVITNANSSDSVVQKNVYHQSRQIEKFRSYQIHYLNISYNYPYDPEKADKEHSIRVTFQIRTCKNNKYRCEPTGITELHHEILVKNLEQIYFIEMERTIYTAGETVRFTIIRISSQYWQQITGERTPRSQDKRIVKPIHNVRLSQPDYTSICSWSELLVNDIVNLNCSIPSSASQGKWTIQLYTNDNLTPHVTQSFVVSARTRPTPTVQVVHSDWATISQGGGHLSLKICANESDGSAAYGEMKALICACERHGNQQSNRLEQGKYKLLSQADSQSVVDREACLRRNIDDVAQPCSVEYVTLNSDGCGWFNFNTELLQQVQDPDSNVNRVMLLCVHLFDTIGANDYSQCLAYASPDKRQSTAVYKYGLPINIPVQLNPWYWPTQYVRGTVMEQWPESCLAKSERSQQPHLPRLYKTFSGTMNNVGHMDLELLPIFRYADIQLDFTSQTSTNEDEEIQGTRIPVRALYTESGENMQLWLENSGSMPKIDCVGQVDFRLVGNVPLSEVTLHAIAHNGRSWFQVNLLEYRPSEKKQDELCQDTWGLTGNYQCDKNNSTRIKCHPGWQGPGCSEPICRIDCDQYGGFCSIPGTCKCKPFWRGRRCSRCRAHSFNGGCYTGDECDCPWYKKGSSTHRTQTHTESDKVRMIYYRTVRMKFSPELRRDIPVILFYLTRTSSSTLEAITASAILKHTQTCLKSDLKPDPVIFDATTTDSSVRLNVLPPNILLQDAGTKCHARIWDERMLLQTNLGLQNTMVKRLEDLIYIKPHMVTSDSASSHHASTCDMNAIGLGTGMSLDQTKQACVLDNSACSYHAHEEIGFKLNADSWMLKSILVEPRQIGTVGSRQGVVYSLNLPSEATNWRATAYCYGPDIGFWSAGSQVHHTMPTMTMKLIIPTKVSLFEVVHVEAEVSLHSEVPRSSCLELLVRFYLEGKDVWLWFDTMQSSRCLCITKPLTLTVKTVIMPVLIRTRLANVLAVAQLRTNPFRCSENPWTEFLVSLAPGVLSSMSNQNPIAKRTVSRTVVVSKTQTDIKHTGFVVCMHEDFGNQPTEKISLNLSPLLEGIPDTKHKLYKFLRLSGDVAGLLWRHFETGPTFLPSHALDYLAILTVGAGVLNQFHGNFYVSNEQMDQMGTRTFLIILQSFRSLLHYRCYSPNHFSILHDQCDSIDYSFNLFVYQTLIALVKSTHPWIRNRIGKESMDLVNDLSNLFAKLPKTEAGCFNTRTGSEEFDAAFTARILSASVSIDPADPRMEDPIKCLHRLSVLQLSYRDGGSMNWYSTESLAHIATALSWIDSDKTRLNRILSLIEQREIREGEEGSNLLMVHWAGDENDPSSEIEITAHVYFALHQLGWPLYKFQPIIRWLIVEKQLPIGGFLTSRDLYSAGIVLLDYSNCMLDRNPTSRYGQSYSYSALKITVDVPNTEPRFRKDVNIFGWGKYTQNTIRLSFDTPKANEINVFISDQSQGHCAIGKLTVLFPHTYETAVKSLGRVIFSPDCTEFLYILCLNQTEFHDAAVIILEAPSGWIMVTIPKIEPSAKVKNMELHLNSTLKIVLRRPDKNNVPISNSCLSLRFISMGTVNEPMPLRLSVITWSKPTHLPRVYHESILDCYTSLRTTEHEEEPDLETEQTDELPPMGQSNEDNVFDVCPQFVDPSDFVDYKSLYTEMLDLCNQTIQFIRLRPKNHGDKQMAKVYLVPHYNASEVNGYSLVSSWKSKLPPKAYLCPQFSAYEVFIVLNRVETQIWPGSRLLNLRPAEDVDEPISLLVLHRERPEFVRLLYNMTFACPQWDTVVRLMYHSLS